MEPPYPHPMRANDGTGQRGYTAPQHVWVRADELAAPGILLDWRVTEGGTWEAYVVWADGGGDGQARAHLEWVGADRVRPRE